MQVKTNMETTLKFHKPRKWRNSKNWLQNWFIYNLRKTYSKWIPFRWFAFKIKLINLFSFLRKKIFELKYWNDDLKVTERFVNETCTVHNLLFLKKTQTCLSFCHKDLKKIFSWILTLAIAPFVFI